MILEALEYLTTPCPGWARRLGYLSEAIAIRHRAKRCRTAWAPHLTETKKAILENCPKHCGEAVILGAGLCHDVPVRELASICGKLTLVDAVHLRGGRYPRNVTFKVMDVHGIAEALDQGISIWDRGPSPLDCFNSADYVVSVNLLSQLPVLPIRQIEKEGLSTPLFEHGVRGKVMREHINDLGMLPGRTLLIGDARRRSFDRSGTLLTDENLAAEALLPEPESFWTWQIIPPGEGTQGMTVESTVGMWNL